jgi:hypothetical protein
MAGNAYFEARSAESWRMPARPQKITFGEMRSSGDRGLLVYCRDYKCSHMIKIAPAVADRWPDELRLSDLEPRFVCTACGKRGPVVHQLAPLATPEHNIRRDSHTMSLRP